MAIYESERLLDQAIDQLELELAAQGEKDIFFQNDLDEVLFVNWNCDRQSLMSQESTWSGGLSVAVEGVEVGGALSNTEKKEFTYQYMSRAFSFTKIQPHSLLEESTGLNCKRVFVDIWTIKHDGALNKFMSGSGVDEGELVIISGTADAAKFDKTFEVCGGDKCGCVQNKCWKTCMGISKCDTQLGNAVQKEDHFYRNSADYKRYVDGGRKLSALVTWKISAKSNHKGGLFFKKTWTGPPTATFRFHFIQTKDFDSMKNDPNCYWEVRNCKTKYGLGTYTVIESKTRKCMFAMTCNDSGFHSLKSEIQGSIIGNGDAGESRKKSDAIAMRQVNADLIHGDGKVICREDRECKPSFPCKGACLLWG